MMRAVTVLSTMLLGSLIYVLPASAMIIPGIPACSLQSGSAGNPASPPQSPGASGASEPNVSITTAAFNGLADSALVVMRKKADEMKVGGVAVVAYFEGEKIESWTSKMVVVGKLKDEPNGTQKGSNLLAIAYAKAAEMADTLRDSGSQLRPPMIGEFGWQGGVVVRVKTGYLIAAFSGGQSADDVAIARAGLTHIITAAKVAH